MLTCQIEHYEEELIMVVSHAGVGRIIEAKKRGIELASFYDLDPYSNAEVVELGPTFELNK